MRINNNIFEFDLPKTLACPLPTEERGIARDDIGLLITSDDGKSIQHTKFKNLYKWLQKGDVLVVNTSATKSAAIPISLGHHKTGVLHLGNQINPNEWLVEIREVKNNKTIRWYEGEKDMEIQLPEGGQITLKERFYQNQELIGLWKATLEIPTSSDQYLKKHARPIKYDKLDQLYPLDYYQTIFSFHPGSSEMPSAGRGFTPRLMHKLLEKGIFVAPVLLHTGLSSLEENEMPYPEYMEVNPVSASIINLAKQQGRRVITVGTTALRAIETAATAEGMINSFKGYTDLFISEDYELKITDGLLTGFHEPKASHLHMLQAISSLEHLDAAYTTAIEEEYYWHEFGDLHLILK